MNDRETKAILSVIKAAYPSFGKDADPAVNVKLWERMFAGDQYRVVLEAVDSLIATSKFNPTIADVKEKVFLLTTLQPMTELEAWQLVHKAISYYNAQEKFDALPQLLQKLVGSPNQLREWALMDSETVNSVIQSNFMRSYTVRIRQEKEMSMLPESARTMIQALGDKLALGTRRQEEMET